VYKGAVRLARTATILLVVLLVPACGGGDGGGRLSASELRDRAEAICRDIEERDVREPTGLGDVDRYVDEFTAVVEESAADFHELEPPEELQESWDEYLEVVDDAVSRVQEFGDDVAGATEAEIAELAGEFGERFEELEQRGRELERELGLDDCLD
jgi:hypothetical protein